MSAAGPLASKSSTVLVNLACTSTGSSKNSSSARAQQKVTDHLLMRRI